MASLGRRLKHTLRGRRPRACKLDESTVAAVKRDLASGMTQKTAAKKYRIARQTVGSISTGLTWGWVQPLPEGEGHAMTLGG
jgi:hypothetical protein